MDDVRVRPPSALQALRSAWNKVSSLRQRGDAKDLHPQPLMERFESIRSRLQDLGLFGDDTLVLLSSGGNRVIVDAKGTLVSSSLFDRINASYAVFSAGTYSLKYAGTNLPLKASCDDMAQLFGPRVPCGDSPWADLGAFLVKDRGFIVTGRYEDELIAAAILIEKACRVELLSHKVGIPHYLNPALCLAEHAVYLASYSKHEKEANDGQR